MKIVFQRQAMMEAVSPLMCAIGGKSTLSAIEGILVDAKEDGTCVLTTFDLEKGMRSTVNLTVEEPGSYIINAQKFVQILRVMEGEYTTMTVSDNLQVCIESGKSTQKMNALPGSDYPVIPRLSTEDGFVIGQSVLKEMLAKVMYAMAYNDQRQVLNGCYFKVTEGKIMLVSCDSFKLAKCVAEADIENKNEDGTALSFSFIVPSKSVGELYKLLKDDERETVRIYMTRKNIVLYIGELIFFSRLIEGVYIDYDRIILRNHRITAKCDRDVLISALERAAIVTEEKVAGSVRSHVKLLFEGDLLKIMTLSTMGSTYDEVEVEHEGDDLLIAFNNRFLLDSLKASDAERVCISLTSALTSINIEPESAEEGREELFMLLPVRMKE